MRQHRERQPTRADVLAELLAVEEVGDGLTIHRMWVEPPTKTIS